MGIDVTNPGSQDSACHYKLTLPAVSGPSGSSGSASDGATLAMLGRATDLWPERKTRRLGAAIRRAFTGPRDLPRRGSGRRLRVRASRIDSSDRPRP